VDPGPRPAGNPLGFVSIARTALMSAGLVLIVYYCAFPNEPQADDPVETTLEGTYTVNGVDRTGAEYSGTVRILDLPDGTFEIEWIVTDGIQRGIGERRDARFEADWRSIASTGDEGTGTAVYDILDDGRLVGVRTVDGFDQTGTEELLPDP